MRIVGYWVGKARGVGRQVRSGFDAMVREAELDEMEKKWAEENERIMREHPSHETTDTSVADAPQDQASLPLEEAPPVMVEKPRVEPAVHTPAADQAARDRDADNQGKGAIVSDADTDDVDASRAPLLDHLIELRRRLLYCIAALVLTFAICMYFAEDIFAFLVYPLLVAGQKTVIYTEIFEAFFVQVKSHSSRR